MAFTPLTDVFGETPQAAPYTSTIFSDEQLKALEEDLKAFPQISQLGDLFQQSYLSQLEKAIPGFGDILKTGGLTTEKMQSTALQELGGQIPKDVQEQIQRSSAFQNLTSGAGGGMANANVARNLGLTSLDLINQGANLAGQAGNSAQRWAQLSGAGGAENIMAGMLVTPQQQAALTMQNNLYKQATQQLRNNLAAAPSPAAAGISNTIMNLIGAYIGHGALGAGGGSQQQKPSAGSYGGAPGTNAGAMGYYNPNYNYGMPGYTGGQQQGGFNYFNPGGGSGGGGGGGGGGASGAGTSALGVAGTTDPMMNAGVNLGGIPDIFASAVSANPYNDPFNFGTSSDPTQNPFGSSNINLNLGGTGMPANSALGGDAWSLSNLFGPSTGGMADVFFNPFATGQG